MVIAGCLAVVVATFVVGSIYGTTMERKAIAEIMKAHDYLKVSLDGAQKRANRIVSTLEARVGHYL